MNLYIKGKGEKESRGTQGCNLTAEHVKQENMESENMTKSYPHTLAEVTIQRGSSFTSLKFNNEVWVRWEKII